MRPISWLLALALVSGVGVWPILTPSRAAAHDVLVGTSPAAGATVAVAPDSVQLTFSEPVLTVGEAIRVTGPGGQVQVGAPQIRGARISQALRPGAPTGRYLVRWQVASNDGHPVAGQLAYTVRAQQPSASPSLQGSSTTTVTDSVSATARPSAATANRTTSNKPADADSGTGRTALIVVLLAVLGALGALLVWRRRR